MLSLIKQKRLIYWLTLTLVLVSSAQPTTVSLVSNVTIEPYLGSASGTSPADFKVVDSVSAVSDVPSGTTTPQKGWDSQTMPNPWTCPSCCGITQRGWICDPDGVFQYKVNNTGLKLADQLNGYLWKAINSSVCPCHDTNCHEKNVTLFVAVVQKLANPHNYSAGELIYVFANSLQKRWGSKDSGCQTEILIALSLQDSAMTTVLGRDITSTGMMRYEDVNLVGGISQTIVPDANLFGILRFLITSYGMYINHPVLHTGYDNVTDVNSGTGVDDDTLEPGIIVLIVLSVVFVFVALGIVALPFYCRSGVQVCKKDEKPET